MYNVLYEKSINGFKNRNLTSVQELEPSLLELLRKSRYKQKKIELFLNITLESIHFVTLSEKALIQRNSLFSIRIFDKFKKYYIIFNIKYISYKFLCEKNREKSKRNSKSRFTSILSKSIHVTRYFRTKSVQVFDRFRY